MIKPFKNPFSLLHFKETFTPKNILANLITWLNGAISLSLMFKSFINSAKDLDVYIKSLKKDEKTYYNSSG